MSTLVPNGISILSAILKADGFKNIQLFDPTFYQSPEETRAMKKERVDMRLEKKWGKSNRLIMQIEA